MVRSSKPAYAISLFWVLLQRHAGSIYTRYIPKVASLPDEEWPSGIQLNLKSLQAAHNIYLTRPATRYFCSSLVQELQLQQFIFLESSQTGSTVIYTNFTNPTNDEWSIGIIDLINDEFQTLQIYTCLSNCLQLFLSLAMTS